MPCRAREGEVRLSLSLSLSLPPRPLHLVLVFGRLGAPARSRRFASPCFQNQNQNQKKRKFLKIRPEEEGSDVTAERVTQPATMVDQAALVSLAEACDAENADPLACYGDFFVAAGDALRAALVRPSSDPKNESQCELVSCACDGSALGVYEDCEIILEEAGAGGGHGGGGEARRNTLITLFVTLGICFCVCVVVGVPLLWWLRRRHLRRKVSLLLLADVSRF